MKTAAFIVYAVALFCVVLEQSAWAVLPATDEVAQYQRCDSEGTWRDVSREDGDIILASLREIDSFKTWGSTIPPGWEAIPIPAVLGFRFVTKQGVTNLLHFSCRAELVDCPRGLLVIPDKEEAIIAVILTKWEKEDNTRIASQPLPCKYKVGTANDGNTLSGISRLFYGDTTKWREIYEANRGIIKNPDIINGGMVITIPRLKGSSNK